MFKAHAIAEREVESIIAKLIANRSISDAEGAITYHFDAAVGGERDGSRRRIVSGSGALVATRDSRWSRPPATMRLTHAQHPEGPPPHDRHPRRHRRQRLPLPEIESSRQQLRAALSPSIAEAEAVSDRVTARLFAADVSGCDAHEILALSLWLRALGACQGRSCSPSAAWRPRP